jgi:cell division protein FtsI (penicillin-binding protein 3)
MKFPSGYIVGGKTGSAQVASVGGGYREKLDNGTYAGFVGGNKPQYIVVVYNLQPDVAGYAGSMGGQPVFADLVHMLIDNGYVTSKH